MGVRDKTFYKDKDDKIVVTVNWSRWLATQSSSINTATWAIDPTSASISDESNTTTHATAHISGGELGTDYELRCTIVTNDSVPRTETRTMVVRVQRKTQ